ncbi:zinc finger protein 318 [Amblyraja radiata]|uniref:zinc finger protein 318 n=1 Tax=Amblyraja radiata TaxID=386614 RepID=UPI001401D1D1|nr:zinc finger protein 318 [Amblyraja radiata]XP_032876406.1 zinc finger protein 318 [Amblyraja radiata]XP_032876407.1 zinc finger protein 318 [Amblyraja radiata]XP_032876408.1 zinc finger protein 318 [Amblyraja radiata]
MADRIVYRSQLPQSARMQAKYSLHDDQSEEFLDMMPSSDSYKRRVEYGSHNLSQREGRRRSRERDGDKYKKIPYSHLRSDDRGRDPKRSRLEHRSHSRERHSRERHSRECCSRSPERHRNYRIRSPDRPQNPNRNPNNSHARQHFHCSKSKNDEFRELEIARRRKEQEERIIAEMLPPSQREHSHPSYGHSERFERSTMGMQHSPRSDYVLHRPDDAPQMPKKSILKKRTEPGLEPSTAMQFDDYRGVIVNEKPEHLDRYSPLQSYMRLPQQEPNFTESEHFSFMLDSNKMHRITEQDGLPGLTNTDYHFERVHPTKYDTKSEMGIPSENKDCATDFLLPHEQASRGNSGFSHILGLLAEVDNNLQERNFADVEDEERFLYGEDEEEKTDSDKFRSPANRNLLPVRHTGGLPEGLSSTTGVKPDKEYEKIHDLLRTIGLDIGVSEISKLAARTQERLHGKKASTRSADCPMESHNSGSWDNRRTRNDTKSPESRPQSRIKLPKQENMSCPGLKESEESFQREMTLNVQESERAAPRYSTPTDLLTRKPGLLPTPSPSYVMPPYAQYPLPPINYLPNPLPPNFNQYDPYLAYSTPAWPAYPPPQVSEPSSPIVVMMQHPKVSKSRRNLRVIETVNSSNDTVDYKREDSVLVQVQTTPTPTPVSSTNRILMSKSTEEEKRKSEQKRKVLEEREKLQKEKASRQKRLEYLENELLKLCKQQGELLRKKRREKDGHKDPLLVKNGKLQEDINRQMSIVRQQVEETVKKLSKLEKVAQILGVMIQEKTSKSSDLNKDVILEQVLLKGEQLPSSKEIATRQGSLKEMDANTKKLCESFSEAEDAYEYYDAGNHWCKNCNTICGTLFDFFTHMHNKRHRQTLDPYDRPWSTKMPSEDKNDLIKRTDKITMPAKGSEFLMPVTGFYCQLCEMFYGDQICAEDHVKSHGHNDKYKGYLNENPVYEQRRNLDRQAGFVVIMESERRRQAGLKRKIDEEKEVQKQKKFEESEESKAKLIKLDVQERESVVELEEERNYCSSQKIELSCKPGIKLMLKKDEIEDEKDEEQGMSFGKFSWKKPEKEEEKSSSLGAKEEHVESSKERDDGKGQGTKSATKTIEIKLSGKTLIAHTSPWVPFTSVTTTTHAKIRPNLPVANVPQRKGSITSVNKPAPLDTFLSIRSSGASNKPLPVVKAGMLLAPEVISRAFGGEEVTLKGSVLDVHKEPDPLAEEPAPGVSECEQTILAIPVRPPPPPTSLSDFSKKMEKPKSCLAAANAEDLYGIYYSSSGKSPGDCRLGSSTQNIKLVHGTLKSVPSQVKIGGASCSKELVPTENTDVGIPKAAGLGKKNEMETEEQAGSRYIPDVQGMSPCGDDVLSNPEAGIHNKSCEVTVAQHDSHAKKVMGTAEQGDGNFVMLKLAENNEEFNTAALEILAEQPQHYNDGNEEAENVELHALILEGSAEQSLPSIISTAEHVKKVDIDAFVVNNSAEDYQQSDDLSTLNAFKVKKTELVARTSEQPQASGMKVCSLIEREAKDIDAVVIIAGALSDAQKDSSLAAQIRDEMCVLDCKAMRPEQCDANLDFPIPTKQGQDLEMDGQISHNTTKYLKECDISLSFSEPVDQADDVESSASELDTPAAPLEDCYTGPSPSQPMDEVDDVTTDISVLDSVGGQLEHCETGSGFSEQIDVDKDVTTTLNNAEDQPNKCATALNLSKSLKEVKDVRLDVPALDSAADHPEQCDTHINIPDSIDEVKDVEPDVLVSDHLAKQLKHDDTQPRFSNAMDEVKGIEVGALVSDSTRDLPGHCDIGISFSEPLDEVEDIKVDDFILENSAEAGISILNPVDKMGDLRVNAPILHRTVGQQQRLDKVEQVRDEEIDGGRDKLIGNSEMCSSFQTDLCPLLDQQRTEIIHSLHVGTRVTEKQDTSMSSSLQSEQIGSSKLTNVPQEQCKNTCSSQQPKHSEVSVPDARSDRDEDESSFPESELLNDNGKINILDPSMCCESEVNTLIPETQTAGNGADPSKQLPLHNINVSTSERAEKDSSMPSSTGKAVSGGHVGTGEEYKVSGSPRTSSRRAAQAGKAVMYMQPPDQTTVKHESIESEDIQAPNKQLRRRSARNLRSPK